MRIKRLLTLVHLLDIGWSVLVLRGETAILEKAQVKIKVRLDQGFDLGHIVEIYESKTYLTDVVGKVVVDVGMSNADSSIYFAIQGANLVLGLEPFPESYQLALENIKLNRLEKSVLPINCALSDDVGSKLFFTSDGNPNAGRLGPSTELVPLEPSQAVLVRTWTLDRLLETYRIKRIGLLKMDCEGCEYRVIRSLSFETLRKIDEIILEYHEGVQDLYSILKANGFRVENGDRKMGVLKAVQVGI